MPFQRRLNTLLALALGILVAGCTTSPPKPSIDYKPDYNFSNVRTVAFYRDSGQVTGSNPLQLSDIERDRVDTALVTALEHRGIRVVDDPSKADLLMSWALVTRDKTDVRTYQTPNYGYGYYGGYYGRYNRYSAYNCWSCAPTRTEVSVRNYTEGTFIVDMIDPSLQQSIWRATLQSRLQGEPVQDQGRYNAAADRIFANFPPIGPY
ncbi:MAG: DUF4136 domain-containing protein [Pseudomonadota bacterium]